MEKAELVKIERYLRRTFSNTNLTLRTLGKKGDSAEVYIGEESVGVLSLDDEDGDRSYIFTMSVLDIDLED